jgi:ubiquinone/menaquinone biosynthesis C-methylase UbiE
MHEFWTLTFNNHHIIAPVNNPREILDIGCGTGIWAIEVADNYPQTRVYGIDISPVQPVYVPDNCCFYLENALEGLSFHDEKFGLVQSRCLGAGIPDRLWSSYIREIWRVTKPGGWVQLIEIDPVRYCDDGSMPSESALSKYEKIVEEVMKEKYQITIHGTGPKLARHAQNAGFVNINLVNNKVPLGKWNGGMNIPRIIVPDVR